MRAPPLLLVLFVCSSLAHGADTLAKELEPLRPFIGKTWKGQFTNSTPEKPRVDVAKWERALNGQAVRIIHSVNDGSYGGESIIMWSAKNQRLEYHYFTTAGFMTHGTMKVDGKKLITRETVTGGEVTDVEATNELTAEGKLRVTAQYFKDGKPAGGRAMTYEEAPNAQVIFR
jgi:hypothetical protein